MTVMAKNSNAKPNMAAVNRLLPQQGSKTVTVPIMAAQSQAAGSTQLGCPSWASIKTQTITVS